MRRLVAILGMLVITGAWSLSPAAAREGQRGTLAIRLRVDRGGLPNRKVEPARIKLRLVVKTEAGFTIDRTERYVESGHTFSLVLPPGRYSVAATSLPPIVNPVGQRCKAAPPPGVTVVAAHETKTLVACVLRG
jgi:hypothetical protein